MQLFADAGVPVHARERDYRPRIGLAGFEAKILKPQNIVEMLKAGARDIGFLGADRIAETGAEVVELLDTGLDPVRLVAAAPPAVLENGKLPRGRLVIATEYERLTRQWLDGQGAEAELLRTYGSTEVFPPEDADCIVDLTASGATLRANGLEIFDELMTSSTRLYGNPRSLEEPAIRERVDQLVMLLSSVLEARRRVMLDLNVPPDRLESVIEALPCMREPTVSKLHEEGWFAVRAAVPRDRLATVIPALKARGARDIVATAPDQIIA